MNKQRIRFVMGPACSGKSTFIKNTFPDCKIIDLYDFQIDYQKNNQVTIQNVINSYEEAKKALTEAVQNGQDVILEHTLMLQKRRPMYIDAVRSVTDAPIDIYVMKPPVEAFKKFRKARNCSGGEQDELDFMEIPTVQEGFENVYIIAPMIKENESDEIQEEGSEECSEKE